ncbi:MAG: crotonase/enoyl-CoA hydratase family protein [Actinomycetota bacterium]|nr:crotonase/enoyl-CoA hydratase family protein [Actinomycetota bacterium]
MSEHSTEPDRVTVTIDNGVADVRLNRPDKRNALDPAMFAAIAEAGERLKTEDRLRAVVLSGEGASFCAGLDFASFQAMAGDGDSSDVGAIGRVAEGRITHLGQQACWVWQEVPVPVIAAVHGHALGGGLQIALGADIRIAHPDTTLSVRELHWGLTPDMTATLTLTRLVRPDIAKELTFSARLIDGTEAAALGLVTRLSETPRDDALAMAADLAQRSPDAVRGAKALFGRLLDEHAAEQFAAERETIGRLVGSPNQVEAVMAGFESRPPVFRD